MRLASRFPIAFRGVTLGFLALASLAAGVPAARAEFVVGNFTGTLNGPGNGIFDNLASGSTVTGTFVYDPTQMTETYYDGGSVTNYSSTAPLIISENIGGINATVAGVGASYLDLFQNYGGYLNQVEIQAFVGNTEGAPVNYSTNASLYMGNTNGASGPVPFGSLFDPSSVGFSNATGIGVTEIEDQNADNLGSVGITVTSASAGLVDAAARTLSNYQGGSATAPQTLPVGQSVDVITSEIGGNTTSDFYSFSWGGGTLSSLLDIADTNASDSYTFDLFGPGGIDDSTVLDVGNDFAGSYDLSLPAGTYTIGVEANSSAADPVATFEFVTPLNGPSQPSQVPEPGALTLLVSVFPALAAIWYRRRGKIAQEGLCSRFPTTTITGVRTHNQ